MEDLPYEVYEDITRRLYGHELKKLSILSRKSYDFVLPQLWARVTMKWPISVYEKRGCWVKQLNLRNLKLNERMSGTKWPRDVPRSKGQVRDSTSRASESSSASWHRPQPFNSPLQNDAACLPAALPVWWKVCLSPCKPVCIFVMLIAKMLFILGCTLRRSRTRLLRLTSSMHLHPIQIQ